MEKLIKQIDKSLENNGLSSALFAKVLLEKREQLKTELSIGDYIKARRVTHKKNKNKTPRVCLVTEELAGIAPSGGIGAAFMELAKELNENDVAVDVLYCSSTYLGRSEKLTQILTKLEKNVGRILTLDIEKYCNQPYTPQKISYAIYKWLESRDGDYDIIHFHDYKGLGFYSVLAKHQALSLTNSIINIQTHGPLRWALEANSKFFTHTEQLRIDFMEKVSLELSDSITSPSSYMLRWLKNNGFLSEAKENCQIIKNCISEIPKNEHRSGEKKIKNLIYFGRHEQRKGLRIFCTALKIINKKLKENKITVIFLGGPGEVNDAPSMFYLENEARTWEFEFIFKTGLQRDETLNFLWAAEDPLVCVCSPYENSPYAASEAISLGLPLIVSNAGGAKELFSDPNYEGIIEMNPNNLARTIEIFIKQPPCNPAPSETSVDIAQKWLNYHRQIQKLYLSNKINSLLSDMSKLPLVSVIITHFERPYKLIDTIKSIILQTYPKIELIVVDDGSRSEETLFILERKVMPLLTLCKGKIVRQANKYLGAARNSGLEVSTGEYLCFIDDDDIALPTLIEDLLIGMKASNADVLIALNSYMPVSDRDNLKNSVKNVKYVNFPVSYLPTGGPLSLAALENCLGAATSLIKKEALLEVGGYTEIRDVGHEDYELYTKLCAIEKRIYVCPRVLYLYETGRPSMLSKTSISENLQRNFSAYVCDARSRDLISLQIGQRLERELESRLLWTLSGRNESLIQEILMSQHDRDLLLRNYLKLLSFEGKKNTRFFTALLSDLGEE